MIFQGYMPRDYKKCVNFLRRRNSIFSKIFEIKSWAIDILFVFLPPPPSPSILIGFVRMETIGFEYLVPSAQVREKSN